MSAASAYALPPLRLAPLLLQAGSDVGIGGEDLAATVSADQNHGRLGSNAADQCRDWAAVGGAGAELVGVGGAAGTEDVVVQGEQDAAAVGAEGARERGLLEPGAAEAAADGRTAGIDTAAGGAEVRAGLPRGLGERRLVRPRLEAQDNAAGPALAAGALRVYPSVSLAGRVTQGLTSMGSRVSTAAATSLASARASVACSTVGTGSSPG